MYDELIYFAKTPPGLKNSIAFSKGPRVIKPMSNDAYHESVKEKITPESMVLYAHRKFIYTVPAVEEAVWILSGQLDELHDTIIGMDWLNKSVERWIIDARNLPMEQALVRDAHPFSPKALGFEIRDLTPDQEKQYHEAVLRSHSNLMELKDYQKGYFQNPEVLLPFEIPLEFARLENIIQ